MRESKRTRTNRDYVAAIQMQSAGHRLSDVNKARIESKLTEKGYVTLAVLAENFAQVGHPSSYQVRLNRARSLLKNAILEGQFSRRGHLVDEYAPDRRPLTSAIFTYLLGSNNHYTLENLFERCWVSRQAAEAWLTDARAKEGLGQAAESRGRTTPAEKTKRSSVNAHAGIPSAGAEGRKRGRPPTKLNGVIEAMSDDIQSGRLSRTALDDMFEKNLASKYGVSRDTARRARQAILEETAKRPISDK